jgi:DNA-binding transcriptional LysR family regulator
MSARSGFEFNLFRALEVFSAVVETRQVTRAAKLLGMTQSAASQQLRSLETAFGVRLLDRASRPIALTPAGIALHRRAQRILTEVEELKTQLRRLESLPPPVVRIGILPSLSGVLGGPIVNFLKQECQVGEVVLQSRLASDHQELLLNRGADVVVTSDALYDVDGLERHVLMKEPFYLVLPRSFAEQEGKEVLRNPTALAAKLPFLRFAAGSPVGRRVEQHLRRVGLTLPRSIEMDSAAPVVAMTAAGAGFSFLTASLLLESWRDLDEVSLHPLPFVLLYRNITLVGRAGELGGALRNLAAVLAKELEGIVGARLSDKLNAALSRPDFAPAVE